MVKVSAVPFRFPALVWIGLNESQLLTKNTRTERGDKQQK